jgi:hypothetical protein
MGTLWYGDQNTFCERVSYNNQDDQQSGAKRSYLYLKRFGGIDLAFETTWRNGSSTYETIWRNGSLTFETI